jgi:hypothetical protein
VRAAEWRVRSCFGFLRNLALSIHKNAQQVMSDTSPGCYLLKASNNTFHNLNAGASLPPATATLLGLSLKSIPTPRYSPSKSDVVLALDRFERNIGLKTFFAGHSNDEEIPKLQAKSAWQPPLPPRSVDIRVNSFLKNWAILLEARQARPHSPSTTTPGISPGK